MLDTPPDYLTTGSEAFPKLDPNIYRVRFTDITEAEKRVYDFDRKVLLEEKEKVIRLIFTEIGELVELAVDCRPSLHERSNLVKTAKKLDPKLFTDEVLSDKEKFWTVLKSLVGRDYLAQVELKNNWNSISNLMPITQ